MEKSTEKLTLSVPPPSAAVLRLCAESAQPDGKATAALLDRVKQFLPQIAQANQQLPAPSEQAVGDEEAIGAPKTILDDGFELEAYDDNSDSSSCTSSSDSDDDADKGPMVLESPLKTQTSPVNDSSTLETTEPEASLTDKHVKKRTAKKPEVGQTQVLMDLAMFHYAPEDESVVESACDGVGKPKIIEETGK